MHLDNHLLCCEKTLDIFLFYVCNSCINYKVRENLKVPEDGGRNALVVHFEHRVRAGINVLTVVGSPPVRLSALAFVFSSQRVLPVADRLMRDVKDVGERSELFARSRCAARLKFSVLGALPVMYLTNAPQSPPLPFSLPLPLSSCQASLQV